MMPLDLVLVRHGESEGNVVNRASRKGDNSLFTPELRARHSSSWRLTRLGVGQAQHAGVWIFKNIYDSIGIFDRHYTSEYIRAMETAAYLGLEKAEWLVDFYLRERDWGDLDNTPENERQEKFSDALRKKDVEPFYWTPPNGVSMADLCLRIDRVLNTLHRECEDKKVIIVCHGEVMWGFRVRLERMTQERFRELDLSDNEHDKIHNCQILHYTRKDPSNPQSVAKYFGWMRSVCPWDTSLSSNEWQPIVRPRFTNVTLAERVNKIERLVD